MHKAYRAVDIPWPAQRLFKDWAMEFFRLAAWGEAERARSKGLEEDLIYDEQELPECLIFRQVFVFEGLGEFLRWNATGM